MIVWIARDMGVLVSWRRAVALTEGDRIVIYDPLEDNELINCSKAFFDSEVEKGRIIYD